MIPNNLPPDSQAWARWVQDGLIEAGQDLKAEASRQLSMSKGVSATLTQLTQQLATLQATQAALPETLISTSTVTNWQALSGERTRTSVTIPVPAGKNYAHVVMNVAGLWGALDSTFSVFTDIPRFYTGISTWRPGYDAMSASGRIPVVGTRYDYNFAGTFVWDGSVSGNLVVTGYSNVGSGATIQPTYATNSFALNVTAIFSVE